MAAPGPDGRVVELGAGQIGCRRCQSLRPPGPCRWAAGWPCDSAAGGEGAGAGRGPGRWPGRRARRWSGSRCRIAPGHQDLAVGQQGGRMITGPVRGCRCRSRSSPRRGRSRRARRWSGQTAGTITPRHQDLAVGQQGGRVMYARPVARAPVAVQAPRGRVVELGAGQDGTAGGPLAPRHQDLAVGQQGGRVMYAGRW